MNIFIPLGGLGQRFKNEGYSLPKPLIKILGKEMILYVIDNLNLSPDDILHIIYNPELDKYGFCDILNKRRLNINYIKLNKQTEGASETILIGLNTLNSTQLTKKCVLLDCDTFYTTDIVSKYRQQNANAVFAFLDKQNKPIFSYINFDMNNNITEIKEKQKISNFANTGCYCFLSGNLLKDYCQKVINNNVRQNGEYYTSCVIDLMLKDGHKFIANVIQENEFHCVGTPLQLKLYCMGGTAQSNLRICFDLDGTLVTEPIIERDYSTVLPIIKNIQYLQYLKNLGHYIIIHTARRMKTHNSNTGKLIKDIGLVTLNTLEKFEIPYDEIYFGKPWADYYIDDKAINVYQDLEKELGIYNNKIDERNFNQITMTSMEIVIKKGDMSKLRGEIYWYKNIPNSINHLFPAFIKESNDSYMLEKINGIALSYIYLKESMTPDILLNYLIQIDKIHDSASTDKIDIYANYIPKIKERYSTYDYSKFPNCQQVHESLCNYFEKYEKDNNGIISVIHGDPVFSNIIITKDMEYKFIDMRGKQGDVYTIFGDKLYDYGKIYQSLIGYDEILLNKIVNVDYKTKLIGIFEKYVTTKLGSKTLEHVKMICNSLLFTLIPLHDNEKCIEYYNLIKNI
jgi:capsule biosynthesis phosphatase